MPFGAKKKQAKEAAKQEKTDAERKKEAKRLATRLQKRLARVYGSEGRRLVKGLYTQEDLESLARTMIKVAERLKEFKPGIVLVPERGAVPLAKMLQYTLYELKKVDPSYEELKIDFISFPNTDETKYAFDRYFVKKFLGRKEFSNDFIGLLKKEARNNPRWNSRMNKKKRKKLIKDIRELSPSPKRIVLIDEVDTGVSFLVNYTLIHHYLTKLVKEGKMKPFKLLGIGLANNYGRNIYTDPSRAITSIEKKKTAFLNIIADKDRLARHYTKKLQGYYEELNKEMDKARPSKRKINRLREKISKYLLVVRYHTLERSRLGEEFRSYLSNKEIISNKLRSVYNLVGKLKRMNSKNRHIESPIEIPFDKKGDHKVVIYPVKRLVSMNEPKLLGVTFLLPNADSLNPEYLGIERNPEKTKYVSIDLFWHPTLGKSFKKFMYDYYDVLQRILGTKEENGKKKNKHRNHK